MSRRSCAVIAILIAAWALCCLVVPYALWDTYLHDAKRYLLFSPNGEFLPAFALACATSILVSAAAALAASKNMSIKAVRMTALMLCAMSVAAALVTVLLAAAPVAVGCLAFTVSIAMAYVFRAERSFGKRGKDGKI